MNKKVSIPKRPTAAAPPAASADAWVSAGTAEAGAVKPEAPTAPEEPMKRLTIDIPERLHTRVKSQCAKRGSKMADEIRALLEQHFPDEA